jgi:soluble lytic murein transglycosylase-like protein
MTRVYYSIVLLSVIVIFTLNSNIKNIEPKNNEIEFFEYNSKKYPNTSKSILMYETIEKYSDEYDIPKHIVYNIAYKETRYKGPFDWNYNPNRTSSGGAQGPMQVMPATAKGINKKYISPEDLRNDIDLNISTSMKLLRKLYDKYDNWSLVCGYYNTGKPIINEYARFCSSNKNYTKNWVK